MFFGHVLRIFDPPQILIDNRPYFKLFQIILVEPIFWRSDLPQTETERSATKLENNLPGNYKWEDQGSVHELLG